MVKRERLEDLGRILQILEDFDENMTYPNKYTLDNWDHLTTEQKYELAEDLVHSLRKTENAICSCIVIARGHDDLNQCGD